MTIKLSILDTRLISWDENDLINRNCPICNSIKEVPIYIRPDNLNVLLCDNCRTYYISPAPSENQLSLFYSSYDESHRTGINISNDQLINYYKSIDPLSDVRIKELNSVITIKNSKFLDIGFGRGQFLYQLKKLGGLPYGIELDKKAIEFANLLGIKDVFSCSVMEMPENNKYDAIILNDLIEHPLDPMSILKKVWGLLKEGGLLLIWTPNGHFSKTEDDPTTFRVDLEHMQYFTSDTVCYIGAQLNMKLIHLETLGFPSLNSLNRGRGKNNNIGDFRKIIKAIPGFSKINKIRQKIFAKNEIDDRLGNYHLFCILMKN